MVQMPSPMWYADAGGSGSQPKYSAIPNTAAAAEAKTIARRTRTRPGAGDAATVHASSSTAHCATRPKRRHVEPKTESAGVPETAQETASGGTGQQHHELR